MKVFISWSGTLSKTVAEQLRTWLRSVIQALEPFVSSHDISKGDVWLLELLRQLEQSAIGIICVSRENLNSNWMLFEAGALTKGVGQSKVCTLLIDIGPAELRAPLSSFQATTLKREDVFSLLKTINELLGVRKLTDRELDAQFDKWWDELDQGVRAALAAPSHSPPDIVEKAAEDLLLPVIYRESGSGDLDTVFDWIRSAENLGFIARSSKLGFVEAALSRIAGKPRAAQNLREIAEKNAPSALDALVELMFVEFAAFTRLANARRDSEFVRANEQTNRTRDALLAIWALREGATAEAQSYWDRARTSHFAGDRSDIYRAIPMGVVSFALGEFKEGEKHFDLVRSGAIGRADGYPFVSLTNDLDRAFVGACLGHGSRHPAEAFVRERKGHAMVLAQCAALMRQPLALEGLTKLSASWKNQLQPKATESRLLQFQKHLTAAAGTPTLPTESNRQGGESGQRAKR